MDNIEPMTLVEIRQQGLEALSHELGPVELIRFLQQFDLGEGDYAIEREKWFIDQSIEKLVEQLRIQRQAQEQK